MRNTFDLRIRFTGLCLLVPDERPGQPKRLHVLLPNVEDHDHAEGGHPHAEPGTGVSGSPGAGDEHTTHDHGDGAPTVAPPPAPAGEEADPEPAEGEAAGGDSGAPKIVKHVSRLIYDTAYQTKDRKDLTRELACLDLRGSDIKLVGKGEAAIDLHIPAEVADLGKVVQDKTRLERFLDSDTLGPELAARVAVDRGAVTDCLLGAQADLLRASEAFPVVEEGEESRLTAQVEWTIRAIEGTSLTLSLRKGLNAAAGGQAVTLFPIGRTIIVEIWNVPEHELPGAPPPDEEQELATDHFAAFYTLVDASEQAVPRPRGMQFSIKNACVDSKKRLEAGTPIAPGTLMCMNGTVRMP